MELKRALTIFSMKKIPTSNELKREYRKIIKQYHPDHHMKNSEEELENLKTKTQEINEAYEVLKKHAIKENDKITESDDTEEINIIFNKLKQEKQTFINILNTYYTKCENKVLMSSVEKLITECEKKLNSTKQNNQQVIVYFKAKLKEIYIYIQQSYIKANPIPNFLLRKIKFNYDCDCANFYSQLQQCSKKIDSDISKIIKPYEQKEHYPVLKEKINKELNELKNILSNSEITQTQYQELIYIYENKIQILYEEYERKYQRFVLILSKSKENDEETNKIYNNARKIALESSEEDIIKLFNKMYAKEDKNNKDKELLYEKINKLYLKESEKKGTSQLNELFLISLKLITIKDCPPEIMLILSELNFKNPKQEIDTLKKYKRLFLKKELTKEVLCINKINPKDINIAKKISTINNSINYYKIKKGWNKANIYPEIIFNSMYTKIEDFLNQSTFIGCSTTYGNYQIKLLYYNFKNGKILGINEDNEFEIFDNSIQEEFDFYQDEKLKIYQSEDYLQYKINKSINSKNGLDNQYNENKYRK